MKYTALIAEATMGLNADDLVSAARDGEPLIFNYDFEVPDGTSDELVVLIGRGLFWQNNWTMDGTCSTVVEDLTVDDDYMSEDDEPEAKGDEPVVHFTLNQEQSNLVLRAVELLQESCADAVDEENVTTLSTIWDTVFDAGLKAGFGERP